MNIDDFKAKLEQIMLSRIEGDRLGLPAMPAVAARCIELLRSEGVRTVKAKDVFPDEKWEIALD
jgi:hypothetical protein